MNIDRAPAVITPAVAGRAIGPVAQLWERLAAPASGAVLFDPSLLVGLPEPARRFLVRSIAPGAPSARAVLLGMEGRIRIGRWLPFRAAQVLAPPDGFVWAARAGWGPASVRGFDRYGDDAGEMQWRLGGFVPLIRARGDDVSRSAAGRLAAESVFVPAALVGPSVTWTSTDDPDAAVVTWRIGRHTVPVTVHVSEDGTATRITMMRWGNPGGEPFGEHPFAALLADPVTFGGITIPTRVTAGWFYGTSRWEQGEFFRARITTAQFR